MSTAAGTAALVGLLLLGAANQLPFEGFRGLATAEAADTIDGGARIVPPPARTSADEGLGDEGDGMTRTDFEGDDVSPALATYGIDREGNLFEVHSPHTEVPRLAGPTI
jgi:hypothetical protein